MTVIFLIRLREFFTEFFVFLLQFLHPLLCRNQGFPNFLRSVPGNNMLLTVPIEGFNPNHIHSLDDGLVFRIADLRDPVLGFLSFKYLDTAQDL